MIECKNGKTMISGDAGTILAELSSITQAIVQAMGEDSKKLISMAVAMGMSGLFKGKEITEDEYYEGLS